MEQKYNKCPKCGKNKKVEFKLCYTCGNNIKILKNNVNELKKTNWDIQTDNALMITKLVTENNSLKELNSQLEEKLNFTLKQVEVFKKELFKLSQLK
jgi:predicted nucleic-acid-binding Zn-ribbon protein